MNILKEKTLLYAEDELLMQTQYTKYFKNYLKKVLVASNGEEALHIYNMENPDVLILDIDMPKITGLEIAKEIRKEDSDTKIILLTALSDKKTLLDAIELGLISYLEKPIIKDNLKNALLKLTKSFKGNTIKTLWKVDNSFYIWDNKKDKLFYKDKEILLTKQEELLFKLFISDDYRNVTYQDIYEAVWYDDFKREFKKSTIKTMISYLREKLPFDAIKNTYGRGYYLNIY